MRVGAKVKLIAIPADCRDDDDMQTRTLFEKCLGRVFTVAAIEHVEGLEDELIELNVGHVLGKSACLETIWVEPKYLELQSG